MTTSATGLVNLVKQVATIAAPALEDDDDPDFRFCVPLCGIWRWYLAISLSPSNESIIKCKYRVTSALFWIFMKFMTYKTIEKKISKKKILLKPFKSVFFFWDKLS